MEIKRNGKTYKVEWAERKENVKLPEAASSIKVGLKDIMSRMDFTHLYSRPETDTVCGYCHKAVKKGKKMRLYSCNLGAVSIRQAAVCKNCYKENSYPIRTQFVQMMKQEFAKYTDQQMEFLIEKAFPNKEGEKKNGG